MGVAIPGDIARLGDIVSVVLAGMTITVGTAVIPSFEAFRATFLISIAAAVVTMVFAGLIPKQKVS